MPILRQGYVEFGASVSLIHSEGGELKVSLQLCLLYTCQHTYTFLMTRRTKCRDAPNGWYSGSLASVSTVSGHASQATTRD